MSTEVIALSSSPLPAHDHTRDPSRSPRPFIVHSTSSPASLDEPRRSPRFVVSKHFLPVSDHKRGSPLKQRQSHGTRLAAASHDGETNVAVARAAELVTSATSLPNGDTEVQDALPTRNRECESLAPREKVPASELRQAVQAGPAPSINWRANKRGLRREPEDDGEFFLDKSHELYMMHFQPDLIYDAILKTVEPEKITSVGNHGLTFVQEELTIDVAMELQRIETATRDNAIKKSSPHFGGPRSVKASKILAKPKGRGKAKKNSDELRTKKAVIKRKAGAAKPVIKPKIVKVLAACKAKVVPNEDDCDGKSNTEPAATSPHNATGETIVACKRKRGWTPPHDSFIDISTLEKSDDDGDPIDRMPLKDVVRKFSHQELQTIPPPDVPPPPPKRRGRPVGKAKAEEAKKTVVDGDAPEKVKKTPAKPVQPKKPRTITGLALEAYQPLEEIPQSDNSISHFFKQVAKEAKKARSRSRSPLKRPTLEKSVSTEKQVDISVISEGPKAKARKTVKIANDPDVIRPKLLSPTSAARRMSNQDFVFGTSSQLVCEEGLDEKLDLQQALRESMISVTEPCDSDSQLSMRVRKGVWDAAGDQEVEASLIVDLERSRYRAPSAVVNIEDELDLQGESRRLHDQETTLSVRPATPTQLEADFHQLSDDITPAGTPVQALEAAFVNISDVSSPVAFEQLASPISIHSSPEVPLRQTHTFLDTDSSVKAMHLLSQPRAKSACLSPIRHTSVLRDLPTNTSPRKDGGVPLGKTKAQIKADVEQKTSNINADVILKVSQPAEVTTPIKRPRGRPRKTPLTVLADSPPSNGIALKNNESIASAPPLTKVKSPSRKSPKDPKPWTNIEDIEDSEPDATPSPPRGSQTRRLPTFAYEKQPALSRAATAPELSTNSILASAPEAGARKQPRAPSPRAVKAKSYSLAKKETDAGWSTTAAILYPQITNLIKTNREQADPEGKYIFNGRKTAEKAGNRIAKSQSQPTAAPMVNETPTVSAPRLKLCWYEKMLMYDPIVIEDLTEFLVAKGIVVPLTSEQEAQQLEFQKQGIKVLKSRGLEPWMVRAWCEAHGICCLWRASLLGGSRARY